LSIDAGAKDTLTFVTHGDIKPKTTHKSTSESWQERMKKKGKPFINEQKGLAKKLDEFCDFFYKL
jgi:hypothetical protein